MQVFVADFIEKDIKYLKNSLLQTLRLSNKYVDLNITGIL
jgi:hypothetical protein